MAEKIVRTNQTNESYDMTPIEFLKHLEIRCGEAMTRSDSSPAGMMVSGRNTALGEVSSYIGKYLQNPDYPSNKSVGSDPTRLYPEGKQTGEL